MDATVAAMFCVGVVNVESSGLGGLGLVMHGGNVAVMFFVSVMNAESSGLGGWGLLLHCLLAFNYLLMYGGNTMDATVAAMLCVQAFS